MDGTGVPLVTPFDADGALQQSALESVAEWVVEQGVDFVVPCGSNSEAELLTVDERATVIETVVDTVSVPVVAGTGHPGFVETLEQTRRAAGAGADAALVVTPFYFDHDQATLRRYYERLADESPLPIYLYSVPGMTGVRLEPETVEALAEHDNVHGMKDSAGDVVAFTRVRQRTDADFELFIGSGSLFAPGLDAGADGGILALANVVPELTAEIYTRHREGDPAAARALCRDLVELDQAITSRHGVPGVKTAMRSRGLPAGEARSPHQPVGPDTRREIETLVDDALR